MRKGRPSNSRGLHIAAIDMNLSPISPQTLRRNRDATLLDFREALTGPSSTTLAEVRLSLHGGGDRLGGNRQAAAWIGDQGRPAGPRADWVAAAVRRFFFFRPARARRRACR